MFFRPLVVCLLLATAALAHAQEPIRPVPPIPAPGAPGSATPQPYAPPTTPVPIQRRDSAPLLPPAGQPVPGATPRFGGDQPIPQLDQQLRRNSQELDGQRRSQP